jgi:nifR3 family TIM-barrel protein
MLGFWEQLKKPIFVLAPMADVTDSAFRRIIAKYGKPHVMWTEFVSADGLALAPELGRQKLLKSLEYSLLEKPIVAQFFTSIPAHMREAARLALDLGFDGVDINMGCPDKSVEKQGAGASLMKNITLARDLVRAAKEGAPSLPISLKTRIGYSRPELESWLPAVLEEGVALVTVHARTRQDLSKVPAKWEFVKQAVDIRNVSGTNTLIFGNGDVGDLVEANRRVEETGCDGVMLGRAIFGNPFLFSTQQLPEGWEGVKLKLKVLIEHTKLFEELLGGTKSFSVMKKHFKAYVADFDGASDLRARLMQTNNAQEVASIIRTFIDI